MQNVASDLPRTRLSHVVYHIPVDGMWSTIRWRVVCDIPQATNSNARQPHWILFCAPSLLSRRRRRQPRPLVVVSLPKVNRSRFTRLAIHSTPRHAACQAADIVKISLHVVSFMGQDDAL